MAESWEYRFVPFTGVVSTSDATRGQAVEQAVTTFAAMVRTQAVDGWEYYRLDSFPVVVPAGCLMALLGGRDSVEPFRVAVFRRRLGS